MARSPAARRACRNPRPYQEAEGNLGSGLPEFFLRRFGPEESGGLNSETGAMQVGPLLESRSSTRLHSVSAHITFF